MTTGETLGRVIDALSRYANLLLVVITSAYVWLTWRNLKALQRASLRERELRHLEDIKNNVVRPFIRWLDEVAVPALKGNILLVEVKWPAVPKPKVTLGEFPYEFPRQLDCAISKPEMTCGGLFLHAKQAHFTAQLGESEKFLGALWQLTSDFTALARKCAKRIADLTSLPRATETGNPPEFADSDTLVEVCLRDYLAGRPTPQIGMQVPAPGGLEVRDTYRAKVLGKGPTEPTKAWVEKGDEMVRELLAKSGLLERVGQLLDVAGAVRRTLEELEFTYDLPSDCEYVGGATLGPFKRIWRRLRHRSKAPRV